MVADPRTRGKGRPGTVFWFTGLAGSGKTTLARAFLNALHGSGREAILLDGDSLREVFADDLGYTREERLILARRYARLCKLLSLQGFDVICSTISLFHEVHDWNRANFPAYREILVSAHRDVLLQRDQKGLYSQATSGLVSNIVGVDLTPELPLEPDVVLDNSGSESPDAVAQVLMTRLNIEPIGDPT
ncbi:adenylyl-sulfate kinase [bacterium CPR1]|nr:adenylyl-sulfate kinase [bacterium CPR1]